MASQKSNTKLQYLVIGVGLLLLLIKLLAYWLTNSNTILSDALESIVNVVMALVGLASLIIAARPKDQNHPYGHGKIEFLYSSLEGVLIVIAGIGIILKSAYSFYEPSALQKIDLGLLLIAITGLVNFLLGKILENQGKKSQSPTLLSSAQHLYSDAFTTLGIILGLSLIFIFDFNWLDNLIAIIFALWIIYTGIKLIRSALAGIMDEMDEELLDDLIEFLDENRHENWVDIHNFRIIKYGTDLHLDLHLTLPWYLDLNESHAEVKRFEALLVHKFPRNIECFIHTDPCIENSCKICSKSDCQLRQSSKTKHIKWNKEIVRKNRKHD